MNWKLRVLGLIGLLVSGFVPAAIGDTATPPQVLSSTSDIYPAVSCSSINSDACAEVLQIAVDTREQLAPLLNLGPKWLFPVHVRIVTPDDPLADKIQHEAAAVFANDANKSMKIEAAFPSTDPNWHEFVQRQFVVALLWEKFFGSTQTFDAHTKLDVVPNWLIEGLCETLNDDTEHDRENIVKKSVQTQHAPSLQDITGWQQISEDRLMGLWQRAFCFYLVDSLDPQGIEAG